MRPVCEMVGVTKSYKGHTVLSDLSMAVAEGEMVAVTGVSGSGKTTVLNIFGLLEKPDSGAVKLFGDAIPRPRSLAANRLLRLRLAYLFQNYALIDNETVDYNLNVALAYSRASRRDKGRLKATALERVGLEGFDRRRVYGLSGGEQQRVAIARILLKPCDLVLADEPTGSLDAESGGEVLRLLRELHASGKTILLVTHDGRVAASCDRVIDLGEIQRR